MTQRTSMSLTGASHSITGRQLAPASSDSNTPAACASVSARTSFAGGMVSAFMVTWNLCSNCRGLPYNGPAYDK